MRHNSDTSAIFAWICISCLTCLRNSFPLENANSHVYFAGKHSIMDERGSKKITCHYQSSRSVTTSFELTDNFSFFRALPRLFITINYLPTSINLRHCVHSQYGALYRETSRSRVNYYHARRERERGGGGHQGLPIRRYRVPCPYYPPWAAMPTLNLRLLHVKKKKCSHNRKAVNKSPSCS